MSRRKPPRKRLPRVKVKNCRFPSKEIKARLIAKHLRKYAADLPESAVKDAVKPDKLDKWITYCDRPGRIAAVMRWDKSDWYLCTLKNAAVRKDLAGRGIGGKLYRDTAEKAIKAKDKSGHNSCLVLNADVEMGTTDGEASKALLKRGGFKIINRFCWSRDARPAEILHFVRMPSHQSGQRFRCG